MQHSTRLSAVLLLIGSLAATGSELATLCADRTAIERVYYAHRTGNKAPFEETTPPALVERLVKEERHKEAVLKNAYGIEITSALLEAEVQRINTTTRAPEILAEIKSALGNDPARFANSVARPLIVERLLRDKFENDDTLHQAQRRGAEAAREQLLGARRNGASATNLLALFKASYSNQVSEITWQLGPRTAPEKNDPGASEAELKRRFGPDAVLLSSPQLQPDRKQYFAELPAQLRRVLEAQLHVAGDVSAVIELPTGFALYLTIAKTNDALDAAVLSLPKRSYEQWLAAQRPSSPPP